MRTASRRRTPPRFRPHLLPLEERLPLGDGVLGLLVGAALLPPHAAPAVVAPAQGAGERGVFTPRYEPITGGFTPPARPDEAFGDAPNAAAVEDSLTALFSPAARPAHHTLFASPPREQGPDAMPSLALQAGEGHVAAPGRTVTPGFIAVPPHSDGALLTTLAGMRPQGTAAGAATPTQEAQVKEHFGKLPLYFEQNVGQTDASVHYFARGPGYSLFLTSTEAVMVLQQPAASASGAQGAMLSRPCGGVAAVPDCLGRESVPATADAAPPAVVRMQMVGANATPAVTGRAEQSGKVNYFLGNDPSKWHTNVATFGRVEYDDAYPGIDLVYYGNNQQLEYDFVVAPGADPSVIRLNVSGAERLEIDAAGDLVLTASGQELRQHRPFVYQEVGSTRREVASRFVLEGQQVRFAVGAYDAGRPLVIDPVLSYSTYLGGSGGSGADEGLAIAVDPATGDALVTGHTTSTQFPTVNPFQPALGGCDTNGCDAFVARLSASGSALVFATYLGGSRHDSGRGIAVDSATGDALVTGFTRSDDFPTAHAFQPERGGGACGIPPLGPGPCADAFVTRLRADGRVPVYSTYLGGNREDQGAALAVDPGTGDTLVTGSTNSPNFPTANPFQPALRGFANAFVTRLRADGRALVYSTYLGGSRFEGGSALAVDPSTGDALLTGSTGSFDFPTANPLQPACASCSQDRNDAFVTRLNAAGSALVFSTYLGGNDSEASYGVAVDPVNGEALVTGSTSSRDFPTANPFQPARRGLTNAFVTRLRADGGALVYSTYLGGSGNNDIGRAIAVDPVTGDALLTGWTSSTDFPTANPLQASYGGGSYDAFVTRFSASGSALVYSTYLGGRNQDPSYGIAVDPATGDALVTGTTVSTDFPIANAFQPNLRGAFDAFVTRIGAPPAAYYYVYPDSGQVQAGVPFDFYVFALDAQFNVIEDYTGLILFYATDPQAQTPGYHQFQRPNPGYASFLSGLTFHTPGLQELYVFDWPGVQVFGYAAFDVR